MHTEQARLGRPRSEQARTAVLHAVDDMLVEVGYSAMTMKGIAERAGVGRQTVYRWWSTKAEILAEAVGLDAPKELTVKVSTSPARTLERFVDALLRFLTDSEAGQAYRALLGEAQHDPAVAALLSGRDAVADTARAVLTGVEAGTHLDDAVALLVGPPLYWILAGRDAADFDVRGLVRSVLRSSA